MWRAQLVVSDSVIRVLTSKREMLLTFPREFSEFSGDLFVAVASSHPKWRGCIAWWTPLSSNGVSVAEREDGFGAVLCDERPGASVGCRGGWLPQLVDEIGGPVRAFRSQLRKPAATARCA